MTGWRLAVVIVIAFGSGYTLASWFSLIRHEETHIRLYRALVVAKANQNHELCQEALRKANAYGTELEARLDALEHPGQVVDEAERITREGS